MKKHFKLNALLLIVALFFASNMLFSQKAPIKFGKVSKQELEMVVYEKDTAAEAVVLAEYCKSEILYDKQNGFMIQTDIIKRIKILKKSGLDYATVEIPIYYNNAKDREKIAMLKAQSYTMEKKLLPSFQEKKLLQRTGRNTGS